MGIIEEDVARVRAATDFVALAAEHIALKRVGRNYSGLCPFHTEKSPSFSINPEKGVYYCYGCGAKGDVITFVRELEKLDFSAAVERLAAKANVTLRYDNEAAGRDRVRRTKLLEAMEHAVDWYHERLLTGSDAGRARSYLRSRGYDAEAIRRFRIGWAPDGWDTLCRALDLPTDVARDTGLGYLNKIGKVNDFFQSRILFPIFDASGSAIAFGGRKLPDAEGPKYKNSSETKVYSKSRTLYGLNWAKAGIVEAGEVIVCEGYTDVIGFHRAGLARAVATCGTALADEHFRMLKNYARRIVLAYDADAAGQTAAEKFYAWEKAFEIDLHVVALPPGADPADLARTNPDLLKSAVAEARPFLQFRIERLLGAANLRTPEGRARAYESAAAAIFEHPNGLVREQYLLQVAGQCQISEATMARTLANPPTPSPRQPARSPRTDNQDRSVARPKSPATSASQSQQGESQRSVANEDLGHERPPSDGALGPPVAPRRVTSPGRASVRGRASSASTRGDAAQVRALPAELEVLRWLLARPEAVLPWLDPVFFADAVAAEAFELLATHGDLREASDRVDECPDEDGITSRAIALLHRLAVESPIPDPTPGAGPLDPAAMEELAHEALSTLVSNVTARAVATMSAPHREATPAEIQMIGQLKLVGQGLHDPQHRARALNQLVPWLSAWGRHQSSETPPTT